MLYLLIFRISAQISSKQLKMILSITGVVITSFYAVDYGSLKFRRKSICVNLLKQIIHQSIFFDFSAMKILSQANFFLLRPLILTPTLSAWPWRGHKALKSILWDTLFLDHLQDFPYYPWIHFGTHFWYQNFMKDISWHQKIIFEGRFS